MAYYDDDFPQGPDYKDILFQYRLTVHGSMTSDDFKAMEACLPDDVQKVMSTILEEKQRDAVAVLSKFLPESSIKEIRRILGS